MFQTTHNMSRTKIYKKWTSMINRCSNTNDKNYKNYGARGIFVCERWKKFENFYEDLGDIPFPGAQIDRIDNEGEYSKSNCKWSSPKQNSRNRRSTKRHATHLGKLVQIELCEKIGWTKNQFRWFFKRYGIEWILENFRKNTLPSRTNYTIDRNDIVDCKFGEWLVLGFHEYTKKKGHLYLCKCCCGTERLIPRNNLIRGKTSSCRKCSAKIIAYNAYACV